MKYLIFLLLIISPGIIFSSESFRYKELEGYEIFESGPWKNLVPGISDLKTVQELLGIGIPAEYVNKLLCFEGTENYKLYIYFNNSIESGKAVIHSIDFIPRNRISMKDIIWPLYYRTEEIRASCAKWIEYSDGNGLIYEVYSSKTKYGDHLPGDLNRISFRVNITNLTQQGDAPETGSSE